MVRDLSDLQRLNLELQQREALLQSILDTVPDGLVLIDQHGRVQSFSAAAQRMFGYAAAEVVGRDVSLLMPADQAAAHGGYLAHYLATGEKRIIGTARTVVARRKDGRTFPVELHVSDVAVGGNHSFVGFVRDLTERQNRDRRLAELQSELIHVSRLSELGQMVSALAHEVNQPLTAITNYASGIRRMLGPDSPPAMATAFEKLAAQAARARDIVQSLRGLVKKEARAPQEENLETMILETSSLALIGAGRAVGLKLRVAADATRALVDKVQIQQVLLNLMRNAVEAMAGAEIRTLTVATRRVRDRIEIMVSDTGPGLPRSVQERLFQPFVTTKAEGLGVGLSICRTIVQAHGGELSAGPAEGGGAEFRFTLPATAAGREPGGR
ncbi:MAG: PAS domain S-box protein [Rhodospirillales bacterium]|nr:PAS domain S-box protein [Rhodospirillales bacterium]MDE2573732.1 PAS domain S-box protein [Rhodospirillales bacterium]